MPINLFEYPCPPELEDEVFMIENAGEMPEVVLAESRQECGPLSPEGEKALAAACARCYFGLIRRDLEPLNVGRSFYRGLERAGANIGRLQSFLDRYGMEIPPEAMAILREDLSGYLEAEDLALAKGRPYASAAPGQVAALCGSLGLDSAPWQGLMARMAALPAPDFLGLKSLARLSVTGASAKRLSPQDELMAVELLRGDGSVLKATLLPLLGPTGDEDPESKERIEAVWAALEYPEAGN